MFRGRLVALAAFGFGVLVYVGGTVVESWSAAAQGALVALGVLAGYAVVAGRAASPAVRWSLVGCVAAVAALVAVQAYWAAQPADVGWFTSESQESLRTTLPEIMSESVDRLGWMAVGLLAAAGCAAVAVWRLPAAPPPTDAGARGRARASFATVVTVTALLVAYLVADVWSRGGSAGAACVAAAVWLPALAVGTAVTAAVLAVRRGRGGWLTAAGALALAGLGVSYAGALASWAPMDRRYLGEESFAVSVLIAGGVDWYGIATAVALIAGPSLVVVGSLRAVSLRA